MNVSPDRETARRKRWEREHLRMHDRDTARNENVIKEMQDRIRKLERSVWTMAAVLGTSTLIGIANLIQEQGAK